jgi:uncharacterized protein (DUF2249 family)
MMDTVNIEKKRPAPRCCCSADDAVEPAAYSGQAIRHTEDGPVLDVRLLPPALKHPTIFGLFDELAEGTSFLLLNDHDPVPVRRQFERMRGGDFTWRYLERGPRVWQVEIGRAAGSAPAELPFSADTTVNEVVQLVPAALGVLGGYGIDTCCGGNLPIGEAAKRHGASWEELTGRIRSAATEAGG